MRQEGGSSAKGVGATDPLPSGGVRAHADTVAAAYPRSRVFPNRGLCPTEDTRPPFGNDGYGEGLLAWG